MEKIFNTFKGDYVKMKRQLIGLAIAVLSMIGLIYSVSAEAYNVVLPKGDMKVSYKMTVNSLGPQYSIIKPGFYEAIVDVSIIGSRGSIDFFYQSYPTGVDVLRRVEFSVSERDRHIVIDRIIPLAQPPATFHLDAVSPFWIPAVLEPGQEVVVGCVFFYFPACITGIVTSSDTIMVLDKRLNVLKVSSNNRYEFDNYMGMITFNGVYDEATGLLLTADALYVYRSYTDEGRISLRLDIMSTSVELGKYVIRRPAVTTTQTAWTTATTTFTAITTETHTLTEYRIIHIPPQAVGDWTTAWMVITVLVALVAVLATLFAVYIMRRGRPAS